jgi:hypothetical protein
MHANTNLRPCGRFYRNNRHREPNLEEKSADTGPGALPDLRPAQDAAIHPEKDHGQHEPVR